MGGNPDAAALVGIPVRRVTLMLFALLAVLVAVAAIVAIARLNAGTNSLGTGMELYVIAAAVIGGAALAGGSGSILGSVLGTLVGGEKVHIRTPSEAQALGIETIYQTLALADNLDAVANLFLGREKLTPWRTLDDHFMEGQARKVFRRLNKHFTNIRVPVRRL